MTTEFFKDFDQNPFHVLDDHGILMKFFEDFDQNPGKGQLIWKCPFDFIVWTKIPTKLFLDFCLEFFCSFLGASLKLFGLPGDLVCNIINKETYRKPLKATNFVGNFVQTIKPKRHFEINWPLASLCIQQFRWLSNSSRIKWLRNSCEILPGFDRNSSITTWQWNSYEILQGFWSEFWLSGIVSNNSLRIRRPQNSWQILSGFDQNFSRSRWLRNSYEIL